MVSISKSLFVLTGVVVFSLSAPSFASGGDGVPRKLKKFVVKGSKVEIHGVSEPMQLAQVRTAAGRTLARGSKLVAIVDTVCSSKKASGLSKEVQKVSPTISPNLRNFAYSFELNEEVDLASFVREAEADECLLQVGDDVEVSTSAVPNDPMFTRQWHHSSLQTSEAWDIFYGADGIRNGVTIAVVDTGVNYNHPDIRSRIWRSSDGGYGYDYVNADNNPLDDNGHGTFCGGLIAASSNNGIGVAGVVRTRVRIMAVKVVDNLGTGSSANLVNGINYAVRNGADVINVSIAGAGESATVRTALANAVNNGVVVVVAAGNNGQGISKSANRFYFPVGYAREFGGVISVGAYDSSNERASFSNYSTYYVEIGAPGVGIYSTTLSAYGSDSGTSYSTPMVTGAAGMVIGLLKRRGVAPTPSLVESLVMLGTYKDSRLKSSFKDGNRLNLRRLAARVSSRYP